MKKLQLIYGLIFLFSFQSCYFGVGLVEEQLTDNISLMAINHLNEAQIIYSEKGNSVYYPLVLPVVFSVGYDDNFIIAKSHPQDSIKRVNNLLTYYHIIEINKISKNNHKQSVALNFQEFESKRKQLNVPKKLTFTIHLK